jgi:hypothetical protein
MYLPAPPPVPPLRALWRRIKKGTYWAIRRYILMACNAIGLLHFAEGDYQLCIACALSANMVPFGAWLDFWGIFFPVLREYARELYFVAAIVVAPQIVEFPVLSPIAVVMCGRMPVEYTPVVLFLSPGTRTVLILWWCVLRKQLWAPLYYLAIPWSSLSSPGLDLYLIADILDCQFYVSPRRAFAVMLFTLSLQWLPMMSRLLSSEASVSWQAMLTS